MPSVTPFFPWGITRDTHLKQTSAHSLAFPARQANSRLQTQEQQGLYRERDTLCAVQGALSLESSSHIQQHHSETDKRCHDNQGGPGHQGMQGLKEEICWQQSLEEGCGRRGSEEEQRQEPQQGRGPGTPEHLPANRQQRRLWEPGDNRLCHKGESERKSNQAKRLNPPNSTK